MFKPKIEKSAIIGDQVILGNNNYIGHNTIIKGNVIIGDNNYIGSNVIIGEFTQHSSNKYEFNGYEPIIKDRKVKIGSKNVLREFTTVHQPMDEITAIKDNCYIMAYNHIAHDCIIQNNVILANNVQMGGHTYIHKYANIGLSTVIHQFATIGAYSMVGMGSLITKDILPFLKVMGSPAKFINKINEFGMIKYGINKEEIDLVNSIYFNKKLSKNDLIKQSKILSILLKFYNEHRRNCISINEIVDKNLPEMIKDVA